MLPIVSGSTKERIVRTSVLMLLLNGFAVAFLWDGYLGYAKGNAKQLVQSLGVDSESLPVVDSRLTVAKARQFLEDIKEGIAADTVTTLSGRPTLEHGGDAYYLGPGGYLRVRFERGRVNSAEWVNGPHTETDQALQRWIGYALGVLGIAATAHFIRVLTTRVCLTDAGLKIGGKPLVPWEAITALRPANVRSGRCIELGCSIAGGHRHIRLDGYMVKDFDSIVAMICERADFPNPYTNETAM